jgi:hypothetical protein
MHGLTFAAVEKSPCIGASLGPCSQVWLPCSCVSRKDAAGHQCAAATARPCGSFQADGLSLLRLAGMVVRATLRNPYVEQASSPTAPIRRSERMPSTPRRSAQISLNLKKPRGGRAAAQLNYLTKPSDLPGALRIRGCCDPASWRSSPCYFFLMTPSGPCRVPSLFRVSTRSPATPPACTVMVFPLTS